MSLLQEFRDVPGELGPLVLITSDTTPLSIGLYLLRATVVGALQGS